MTLESEYDLLCVCGNEFKATLFDSVNPKVNPEVIKMIYEGRFNIAECPKCHEKCFCDKNIVFHSMDTGTLHIFPQGLMKVFMEFLSRGGYFDGFSE